MLVLSRKNGQQIVVQLTDGKTLTITIDDVSRGQVKVGINAPGEIKIFERSCCWLNNSVCCYMFVRFKLQLLQSLQRSTRS